MPLEKTSPLQCTLEGTRRWLRKPTKIPGKCRPPRRNSNSSKHPLGRRFHNTLFLNRWRIQSVAVQWVIPGTSLNPSSRSASGGANYSIDGILNSPATSCSAGSCRWPVQILARQVINLISRSPTTRPPIEKAMSSPIVTREAFSKWRIMKRMT